MGRSCGDDGVALRVPLRVKRTIRRIAEAAEEGDVADGAADGVADVIVVAGGTMAAGRDTDSAAVGRVVADESAADARSASEADTVSHCSSEPRAAVALADRSDPMSADVSSVRRWRKAVRTESPGTGPGDRWSSSRVCVI